MKFNRRIKQVVKTIYYPYLRSKEVWLYLVVIVFITINSLVAVEMIKYLSDRQNKKNINRVASNYTRNVGDRFMSDLDNFQKRKNANVKQKTVFSEEMLDEYLSKNTVGVLAQVTIIDRDGLIVASDFVESDNKSTITSQDILPKLQQRLGALSELKQSKQLNLKIKQQDLFTQVTPWENQNIDREYLVIVTVPKSSLLLNSVAKKNNSLYEYLGYLLPTIISGLLSYVGITQLVKKLNRLKESNIVPAEIAAPATEIGEKQIVLSSNQDNLEIRQPYILLASMGHELRSPLNAILGFAQIMEQGSSTQASRDHIAMINRSGERLLAIINDVVDLAKIETKKLTLDKNNIDFHAWLDNIEQSFQFQARNQGWEFTLIKQNNLPEYICIDERRLRQIVRNLINYCLKSSSSANISLTVSSDRVIHQTDQTNVENSNKKYSIDFEFSNSSFSPTATELASLFDPITRVQKGREHPDSSSLNLPISRKLSQLMGGDIAIKKSITGSGIALNLEIQTESVVAEKLQIQSTIQRIIGLELDQAEYRILVVDDSKTNRKIMSGILESVGFQVQEAVNGSEAIDIWLRWQPHMIWMDLRMPVMNGCEATERIKSSSPNVHIPIVALSASTLEEEKALFKAAGCDDFVGKPFSENIIFDKIGQHLGIRYIYESQEPQSSSIFRLTADSLNVMPKSWLSQLEQGAIELDRDLLTQLLQEIPSEHIDLKNALQEQIDNFDFDRILNLFKNSQLN